MYKRVVALFTASAVLFALSACGGSGASSSGSVSDANAAEDTLHFAIVTKSLSDQHWAIVKAGAEQAAEDFGVQVDVIGPNAESDVQ